MTKAGRQHQENKCQYQPSGIHRLNPTLAQKIPVWSPFSGTGPALVLIINFFPHPVLEDRMPGISKGLMGLGHNIINPIWAPDL